MAKDEQVIDWPSIELEYRAGIRALRSIGEQYGVSEGAIRKRAKRDGWAKDLAPKIRSKAQDLVRKGEVRNQVRSNSDGSSCVPDESERNVIEVNAQVQATVIREHRNALGRARRLVNVMFAELEAITNNQELFARLGEFLLDNPDDGGEGKRQAQDKRLEALAKVLGIPSRVDSLKKLVESLRVVVATEREVFGIADVDPGKENPYEEMTPDQVDARIDYLLKKHQK